MYNRIVIVSDSDTNRGPMAAAIMRELFWNTDIRISSRGMVVLFPEPVNPKCVAICKAKGYDISSHQSEPLEDSDFGEDVIVFALSDKQKKQIYEKFKSATNVYAMKDFIGESGDMGDPYGMELGDYAAFFDKMKQVLTHVKEKMEQLEEGRQSGDFKEIDEKSGLIGADMQTESSR